MRKLFYPILFCLIFLHSFASNSADNTRVYGSSLLQAVGGYVENVTSRNGAPPIDHDHVVGYGLATSNFGLDFTNNFGLKSTWLVGPLPNGNRYDNQMDLTNNYRARYNKETANEITDYALTIQELKLDYSTKDYSLYAGKFNPNFGRYWRSDRLYGVFGRDFALDYRIIEKLGFGVATFMDQYKFSFDIFTDDVSGLSNTALNNREKNKISRNGPANNGKLNSYVANLLVEDCNQFIMHSISRLNCSISYSHQNTNNSPVLDSRLQRGYSASIDGAIDLSEVAELDFDAEVSHIKNFGTNRGINATYLSALAMLKVERLNLGITYSSREINVPIRYTQYSDISDRQLEYTMGFRFIDNFRVDFSRAKLKINNSDVDKYGLALSYLVTY